MAVAARSMDAATVTTVVTAWQQAVIWDNAPSHRAERVRELAVAVIGLPAYSRGLNPVERCFGRIAATL